MALPQQDTHPEATTDIETQRAVTWKAVTIGLILVLAAALGGFYARHILHTTRRAQNHLSLAAVFPFFIVAVFLRRPLRINRGELLVVVGAPVTVLRHHGPGPVKAEHDGPR